jgi:hypothetical protein
LAFWMRADDGRTLDHTTLEALRMRAVQQVHDGEHPDDVARMFGVVRSVVYR